MLTHRRMAQKQLCMLDEVRPIMYYTHQPIGQREPALFAAISCPASAASARSGPWANVDCLCVDIASRQ